MKKANLYFGLTVLVMLIISSCESMNDFHYEYIKDGETIYSTKLDSVNVFPGDNRVKISGLLVNPFGVEEIKIYYNDYSDSVTFDYVQEYAIDTIDMLLENLEEKSYNFNIYTGNGEGQNSIMVSAFGSAYGEQYQQSLLERPIDSDTAFGSDLHLHWLPAGEMEKGTEVKYTDNSGSEVILVMPKDNSSIVLTDYSEGISVRSYYIPEETAMDSFASNWKELNYRIYSSTGVFTHPLLGARDFSMSKSVRGITENSFETEFADLGASLGYRMKLKIDDSNNVEVISLGSTPEVVPNGDNLYDPLTETFTLNYKYDHITGERLISETLTKQ